MAELSVQELLQPSLLDRLIDDAPAHTKEPPERRVMSKESIRAAVLRDLGWLFNTTRLGGVLDSGDYPESAHSVLNYGLPTFSDQFASTVHHLGVESAIRQAIIDFEPRILPKTREVELVVEGSIMDTHNRMGLYIRGMLWAQPTPLEFLLRSSLDLEEGRITVEDLSH